MASAFAFQDAKAQTTDVSDIKIMRPATIIDGDTVPIIWLPPVDVFAAKVFKSKREERKYNKLVYNVSKAYPYAVEAKRRLALFDAQLAALPEGMDEKQKKKRAKQMEKELKKEFWDDLSKLTVSQGRLLIKLIDRETEHTTYEIIKDYRGDASAFFWQSFATMFGTNLKVDYNTQEEKDIESIINWLVATGRVKV